MTRNPIFVAVDEADMDRAKTLVRALSGRVGGMKLGLEFFVAHGPAGVEAIMDGSELPLFLDLKLHDIPATVGKAMKAACRLNPSYVTVHCAGLSDMLRAASEAARESVSKPMVLGVTTLTSQPATEQDVAKKAVLATTSGCGGVVCSAHEARAVKAATVTTIFAPGIRVAGVKNHDQKRVASPRYAIDEGADFLVIGRAITEAPDPARAVDEILATL